MVDRNFTHIALTKVVMREVAAGTTSTTSSSVDMLGYGAARFIALFGTLTASHVTNIKLQGSSDNTNFADLTGSATTSLADADSGKILIIDIFKPVQRYLRVSVQRGTANAVINGVLAEQLRASFGAIAADTNVGSQKVLNAPAAGTA